MTEDDNPLAIQERCKSHCSFSSAMKVADVLFWNWEDSSSQDSINALARQLKIMNTWAQHAGGQMTSSTARTFSSETIALTKKWKSECKAQYACCLLSLVKSKPHHWTLVHHDHDCLYQHSSMVLNHTIYNTVIKLSLDLFSLFLQNENQT